jgi:hypothetical protein
MLACLQREYLFTFFDAISTYRSVGSVPLYLLDDSTNDSLLLSVDQFFCEDLGPQHYDICLYRAYYMKHTSVALSFTLQLEATFTGCRTMLVFLL